VHSLARLGVDWQRVTHLALTHFHNDHVGDVPFLFFALRYGVRQVRHEPLTVLGPAGTGKLFRRLSRAFGSHLRNPGFEVTCHELATGETIELCPGVHFSAQRAPHTDSSLAYRVQADRLAIGYTGDTGESAELGAFMRGVDVLIAECSLPEHLASDGHLTPSRLARLATLAAPRVLVATHVFPELDRAVLADAVRRAGWRGRIVIARDGLALP